MGIHMLEIAVGISAGWCSFAIIVASIAGRIGRGDRPVGHDDDQQAADMRAQNRQKVRR